MTSDATEVDSQLPNADMPLTPFLNRICGHLSHADLVRVALTCQAWSMPALSFLWSQLKFVREREFDRVFAILALHNTSQPYRTFVTAIDLHHDRELNVTPTMLYLIASLCSNLESIAITFHHTRPAVVPVPPAPAPTPRPVLPPTTRKAPTPTPATGIGASDPKLPLAHLAHNCKRLRSLRLSGYVPKTDNAVYEFAKYTRGLDTIVFTGCTTLQGSTLCKLAMTNPQLRHVEIMNTAVSDSSLATIADRCGQFLQHIDIGNAYQLSDKSLRYVAKHCKQLKQICLFNNPDLGETALVSIVKRCTHLQVISLSNGRSLKEPFFEAVVARVQYEMASIEGGTLSPSEGLQRICLGAVHRAVLGSATVRALVSMGAGAENDDEQGIEDQRFEDVPGANPALWNTTMIRGGTIWWQRRRQPSSRHT